MNFAQYALLFQRLEPAHESFVVLARKSRARTCGSVLHRHVRHYRLLRGLLLREAPERPAATRTPGAGEVGEVQVTQERGTDWHPPRFGSR